ncbi:MAG: DUF4013 domain-containing protein [Anaerolineae bacterium]|nr:DUF4013 domain-containing protein [Anaerolineae bacterium]
MFPEFSFDAVKTALSMPFNDPKWATKLLILLGVNLLNFIIPIVPAIVMLGYIYAYIKNVLQQGEKAMLPEWNDFGRLLVDGLKYFGAMFVYALPAIILFTAAFGFGIGGSSLGTIIGTNIANSNQNLQWLGNAIIAIFSIVGFGVMALFLAMFGLYLILMTAAQPVAVTHMVEHDQFKAAFRIREWWNIFKTNWRGFLLCVVVVFVLGLVISLATSVIAATFILSILLIILTPAAGLYQQLVSAILYGRSYRWAADRAAPLPVKTAKKFDLD